MKSPDRASPTSGSLTTQSGNSRTVVSWQTANAGPNKSSTVTKHSVSKPNPNAQAESFQTIHKEEFSSSYTSPQHSSVVNSSPPPPPGGRSTPKLPPNAFSYGSVQEARKIQESFSSSMHESSASSTKREGMKSPTPPPRDSSRGRVTSPIFRDRVESPTIRNRIGSPLFGASPQSSKMNTMPYRVDYENEANRGYFSDSEHSLSWLQQQQVKLKAKREGRGVDHRTKHEEQLVTELKNAQNSFQRRRTESESNEKDIIEQYSQKENADVFMANGPSYAIKQSPDERYRRTFSPTSLQRSASAVESSDYKTEKKYYVSGVERPPFTSHQTKYTFSVSPPKSSDGAIKNKPPPAPGQLGRSAPTSPIIPQRGVSSQSAVQSRSKSATREWTTGRTGGGDMPYTDSYSDRSYTLPAKHQRSLSSPTYDITTSNEPFIPFSSHTHRPEDSPFATLPRTRSRSPSPNNTLLSPMENATARTLPRSRSKSPSSFNRYSAVTFELKKHRPKYLTTNIRGVSRSATLPRNFRQSTPQKFRPSEEEVVESHHEEIFIRRPVIESGKIRNKTTGGCGNIIYCTYNPVFFYGQHEVLQTLFFSLSLVR